MICGKEAQLILIPFDQTFSFYLCISEFCLLAQENTLKCNWTSLTTHKVCTITYIASEDYPGILILFVFLEIFSQCGNWNVKQIPFNIDNIVISIYYIYIYKHILYIISITKRDCQGFVSKMCRLNYSCFIFVLLSTLLWGFYNLFLFMWYNKL